MSAEEKLSELLAQVKKVRELQRRFFRGEKSIWRESAAEEKKLDFLIVTIESNLTQVKIF